MKPQRAAPWFLPEAICLVAAMALLHLPALRPAVPQVARIAPGIVAAAGLLLAWRFHRSRTVFAFALLGLAWLLTRSVSTSHDAMTQAVALLLPLNLAAVALLPERGVLTEAGVVGWGMLGLQALVVGFLSSTQGPPTAAALRSELISSEMISGWRIGQPAIAAFALAALLLVTFWILEPQGSARVFLWSLVPAFLGCASTRPSHSSVYFATAGLMLIIGIVEASYGMAYRDALTGLPSRRALSEALDRLDGPAAVAMIDVDHFKQFNDQHGHDVGDQVLRLVAARLQANAGGGSVYRFGGEEFAALYPGVSAQDAAAQLEIMRQAVEGAVFLRRQRPRSPRKPAQLPRRRRTRESRLAVTVSIGVAAAEGKPAADLLKAADRALYRAKEGGRNRVST
ncbi:MAG TPA: GGDEF domain-containing protein [Gemmatimonadales bacterium]|nr:GGDEF domain-containing protein [Gemmatimonadales bacterium]